MGASSFRGCACSIAAPKFSDDTIEPVDTRQSLEADEGILPLSHCFVEFSEDFRQFTKPRGVHDDILVTPIAPVWCDLCGHMLLGIVQQAHMCNACGRTACDQCALFRFCAAREIGHFLLRGEPLPQVLQERCSEPKLVLSVAKCHPSVLQYVPKELWTNETFLCGLLRLDCDRALRALAQQHLSVLDKTDRTMASNVVVAMLQQDGPPSHLVFALELLPMLAEKTAPEALRAAQDRLNDSDAVVRAAAVSAVSHLIGKGDKKSNSELFRKELFRRLSDENEAVRRSAVDALPTLHAEERRKLAALTPRLQDADPSVKAAALRCLQKFHFKVDARYRKLLSKALADRHPDVREAAWSLIPHMDISGCAAVLADLSWVNGLDASTRQRLVLALRTLLDPAGADRLHAIGAAVSFANWWLRLTMCDFFYQYLENDSPKVRSAAVLAVSQVVDKMDSKATARLAELLEDSDAGVSAAAWTVLSHRLEESDADVRRMSVECISTHIHDHPNVLAAVLARAVDSNWLVRTAAIQALQLEAAEEVAVDVSPYLEHPDGEVRRVASEVLAEHQQAQHACL